eukprot:COSAG06_NODE_29740_length_551_cov_0.661504_1_plen_52_part_10
MVVLTSNSTEVFFVCWKRSPLASLATSHGALIAFKYEAAHRSISLLRERESL